MTDGAGALVLCGSSSLIDFRQERAIHILASQLLTGVSHSAADESMNVVRLAASRAYEQAGMGPETVSIAELHDATAFGEITHLESLAFCEPGEGASMAERGITKLGGSLPLTRQVAWSREDILLLQLAQPSSLNWWLNYEARRVPVRWRAPRSVWLRTGGYYAGEEAVAAVTLLGRRS